MAKVKYIGKKPSAIDNVAHSGKVWEGHGDVQEVSDRQARILVGFPDQWVLADDSESVGVLREQMIRFIDPEGNRVEISETALKRPIEHLSKNDLRAYALRNYHKSMHPNMTRKHMIDHIEELAKGMEPFKQIRQLE